MLFGSIENIFGAVQGSAEAMGGSLGTLLGGGSGSVVDILGTLFETLYTASGQEIPSAL